MEAKYFTFTLGTTKETKQYKVIVDHPSPTSRMPPLTPDIRLSTPQEDILEQMLSRLQIWHLDVPATPTATLVNEGSYRIDTQSAAAVFRKIQFQTGDESYAIVTVEHGGELCLGGYQVKLLKYIKQGLRLSFKQGFEERYMYTIRVTVEEREHKYRKSPWTPLIITPTLANTIKSMFATAIRQKREEVTERRMIFAKNVDKMLKKTDMIEHIAGAIERRIAETAEKEGTHAVYEKVKVLSLVLGCFFAADRLSHGNWTGAFLEMICGGASVTPEAGTAAYLAVDGVLLAKDIKEAIEDDQKHKKLNNADFDRLHQENTHIRAELAIILPESPIYGGGCHSYFEESELADLEDIVQIEIRSGDLIDAIQVIYRSQSGKMHGGKTGYLTTFDLEPDERITMVSGTTIHNGCGISSLSFKTDCGREKTFGKVNGEEFHFEMSDGSYLGAIKGYDAYSDGRTSYPPWAGNYQLLPAIGFIPKM